MWCLPPRTQPHAVLNAVTYPSPNRGVAVLEDVPKFFAIRPIKKWSLSLPLETGPAFVTVAISGVWWQ